MLRIAVGALVLLLAWAMGSADARSRRVKRPPKPPSEQTLNTDQFVRNLRQCARVTGETSVAIIDFLDPRALERLDVSEREDVQAHMQKLLTDRGIRTTGFRNLPELTEWIKEGGGRSEAELKKLLRDARDVKAFIIFDFVDRTTEKLIWRAHALTPDGRCSLRTNNQTVAIRVGPPLSAVESQLGYIARQILLERPLIESIGIMPFKATGGSGDCENEFRDRLARAIRNGHDATDALRERRVRVLVKNTGEASDSDAVASGEYGGVNRGLWISLQVNRSDGSSIAVLPRTPVTGSICRGVDITVPPVPPGGFAEAARLCDQLAGNPLDQRRSGDGVPFELLGVRAAEAIGHCEKAARGIPTEPRYRYQLARALEHKDKARAFVEHQKAVNEGYPAAHDNLGLLYITEKNNYTMAANWFQKGASLGDPDSMWSLVQLIDQGRLALSTERKNDLIKRAAELGHPKAIERLRQIVQEGENQRKGQEIGMQVLKIILDRVGR